MTQKNDMEQLNKLIKKCKTT